MISGSIKLYEEPKPYKNAYNGNHYWNSYYEEEKDYHSSFQQHTVKSYQEREALYQTDLAEAHRLGITVGTRVRRKNGAASVGTVIQIHGSATAAFNFNLDEMELLKVEWDKGNPASSGTYDYQIGDLIVVSNPGDTAE